ISGHVYNDVNGNGSFDSGVDTGLNNVTVNLSGTASPTTTTDSSGNYSFTGLGAGTYNVTYTTPTGFADTSLTNPIQNITTSASGTNPSSQGTVTFKNGATVLCSAVALSGNTATCSPSLNAGSYSITAIYSGSTAAPGFSGSTSSALSQTVHKADQATLAIT